MNKKGFVLVESLVLLSILIAALSFFVAAYLFVRLGALDVQPKIADPSERLGVTTCYLPAGHYDISSPLPHEFLDCMKQSAPKKPSEAVNCLNMQAASAYPLEGHYDSKTHLCTYKRLATTTSVASGERCVLPAGDFDRSQACKICPKAFFCEAITK